MAPRITRRRPKVLKCPIHFTEKIKARIIAYLDQYEITGWIRSVKVRRIKQSKRYGECFLHIDLMFRKQRKRITVKTHSLHGRTLSNSSSSHIYIETSALSKTAEAEVISIISPILVQKWCPGLATEWWVEDNNFMLNNQFENGATKIISFKKSSRREDINGVDFWITVQNYRMKLYKVGMQLSSSNFAKNQKVKKKNVLYIALEGERFWRRLGNSIKRILSQKNKKEYEVYEESTVP